MLATMLLKKKTANVASPEALWGASDMYSSYVSAAFPLNSAPTGGTSNGITYVTNAPAPIPNAALFTSGTANIVFSNSLFQLNGYTDFCVEWWEYETGNSIVASLWHPGLASGCAWACTTNSGEINMSVNAGTLAVYDQAGAWPYSTAWRHRAFSRQGSTVRIFDNGAIIQTSTNGAVINVGDLNFYLGYRGESSGLPAGSYLAGFRLTRGASRYTQPFTPSTVFQ